MNGFIFVILGLLFPALGFTKANLATVKYSTELCSCVAKVDSTKIKPELVESAFKFPSIEKPDLSLPQEFFAKANQEYIAKVKAYPFPKNPSWEKLREAEIFDAKLSQYLKDGRHAAMEKNDFDFLLKNFGEKAVPEKCKSWALRLKGDQLVKAHQELSEIQCKSNISPMNCLIQAEVDRDNTAVMKEEVFSFGWHNCVNEAWRSKELDLFTKASEKLESQFISKKCECDEP